MVRTVRTTRSSEHASLLKYEKLASNYSSDYNEFIREYSSLYVNFKMTRIMHSFDKKIIDYIMRMVL